MQLRKRLRSWTLVTSLLIGASPPLASGLPVPGRTPQEPTDKPPVVKKLAPRTPSAQNPTVKPKLLPREVSKTALDKRTPRLTGQARTADLRITGRQAQSSPALRDYLVGREDWGAELLSDQKLQDALKQDPEIKRRLEVEGSAACRNADFVARLLENDSVLQRVLEDQDAVALLDQELQKYNAEFARADAAARRGDPAAVTLYEAAASEAQTLGNTRAEAAALLKGARALEVQSEKQPDAADKNRKVLQLYDRAIATGDADQRSLALNNKGVALLSSESGQEAALAELERIDFESVEAQNRPYFRYNLARAHQAGGESSEALEEYRAVVEEKPSFRPAADRFFDVLIASRPPTRVEQAKDFAEELLASGQARTAQENVTVCLDAWKRSSEAPALFPVMLRSYVDGALSPAEYAKTEQAVLARIAREGAETDAPRAAELAHFASALDVIYGGDLTVESVQDSRPEPLTGWDREMRADLSRLLILTGDHRDNREEPEQAMARYLLSWELDHENTDALVQVAELVRRHGDLLTDRDPLVHRIFEAKSQGYRIPLKTEKDWLNILRYHVLLAAVFEREERWGSSNEVASVIFQLEHAIGAEERVRGFDPSFAPSPALHFRLGRALRARGASGDPTDARSQFALAASQFLDLENPQEARMALDEARAFGVPDDAAWAAELRELTARLARLERGG